MTDFTFLENVKNFSNLKGVDSTRSMIGGKVGHGGLFSPSNKKPSGGGNMSKSVKPEYKNIMKKLEEIRRKAYQESEWQTVRILTVNDEEQLFMEIDISPSGVPFLSIRTPRIKNKIRFATVGYLKLLKDLIEAFESLPEAKKNAIRDFIAKWNPKGRKKRVTFEL